MPTSLDARTLRALNADAPAGGRLEAVGAGRFGGQAIGHHRLGNGLDVLTWQDPNTAGVLAYQTWLGVGSRHEEPGKTGLAHLFEHLMFKGTPRFPAGAFDKAYEDRGGHTNAATWVDWTMYRCKVPSAELPFVVDIEADRLANLTLDEAQLASEREVVLNERRERVDNDPEGRLYEALYQRLYTRHPYRHPTIGYEADIQGLTLGDCLSFYRRYYAPSNATVVAVGDFDLGDLLRLVSTRYGPLDPGAPPTPTAVVEPRPTAERHVALEAELAAERLVLAWPGAAGGSEAHVVLCVVDEILTGGDSSRLHRRLVEDDELSHYVSGWVASWRDPGPFELGLALMPGVEAGRAVEAVDDELARLAAEGPRLDELEAAVNGIEATVLRELGDTGHRAYGLGDAHTTVGDFRAFLDQLERFRAVDAATVQAYVRDQLRPGARTVAHARAAARTDGASR